ncbi:hypothetical protein BBJ28_00002203 [Nothophytophthora sp. Chile5]|nr:hypothetical protein BBJ28_00002203 [Nothophytophthora sp. Chile5]
MQNQGGFGGGGDGDLPSSLPSYMPPASQGGGGGGPTGLPFGYNLLNQSGGKTEGDAAGSSSGSSQRLGQWKTPGQFLYMGNGSRPVGGNKDGANENTQSSPSSGMRSMSFQDGATPPGYQMLSGAGGDKADSGAVMALKLGRQDGVTNSQISAAQFAASTGGLAMDTALLARVSGTDPAMMGSEEIKQIMRTPDLLSIYQKLQEEDDRRQRRLERNRASARVRREKKKGMVETYEGEVSKLESSLNLLKAHTFGAGQAQELASALGACLL